MITNMLNELSEIYAAQVATTLAKQELIDQVITPKIKAAIAEIESEFAANIEVATRRAGELEATIKAAVIGEGKTVKGDYLQAVFAKGRTSWDTKALEGYSAAHPEIERFKTTGQPSISIRAVGK